MNKYIFDPYGFIYIVTNILNGKGYIGQKKFDNKSRWKTYMGGGLHLQHAIKKYGKENFSRTIVAIAYTEDDLNKLEYEWIENYNAVEDDSFYNKIPGGDVLSSLVRKNSMPCICIDNGTLFSSIADASIWSGHVDLTIKNSFTRIHSYNKKKNKGYIFRPLSYIKEGYKLCSICGVNYKRTSNRQKRCGHCINKDSLGRKFQCISCNYFFNKNKANQHLCDDCFKPEKKKKVNDTSKRMKKRTTKEKAPVFIKKYTGRKQKRIKTER